VPLLLGVLIGNAGLDIVRSQVDFARIGRIDAKLRSLGVQAPAQDADGRAQDRAELGVG
jgi:hypothetical protein